MDASVGRQLECWNENARRRRVTMEENYVEWGPPLTREQYLLREETLLQEPFSQHGNRVWALVDPETSSDLNGALAQCETYNRPAWLWIRSSNGNVCMREVQAASVASVFTPERHRGRGYATEMMKRLRTTLLDEGIAVSNLYSDVGPKFYSRPELGWNVYETKQWTADVNNKAARPAVSSLAAQPLVSQTQVQSLVDSDCLALRSQVSEFMAAAENQRVDVVVVFPPSLETFQWFRRRTLFYLQHLSKEPSLPPASELPWGCALPVPRTAFTVYFFDMSHRILYILRSRVQNDQDAVALLEAALVDAAQWNMKSVHWWNPTVQLSPHDLQRLACCVETREQDSLPSLALLSAELQPCQNVQWFGNEKYAWV